MTQLFRFFLFYLPYCFIPTKARIRNTAKIALLLFLFSLPVLAQMEDRLNATRAQAIQTALALEQSQTELTETEQALTSLQKQKAILIQKINQKRSDLMRLIGVSIQLTAAPSQALALQPERALDAARADMVIRAIFTKTKIQYATLRADMAHLDTLLAHASQTQAKSKALFALTVARHAALVTLLEKRADLLHARNIKESLILTRQTQDLNDLMQGHPISTTSNARPWYLNRLPLGGSIHTPYGTKDSLGLPAKGITIQARQDAIVMAPKGGIVRFAGPFRHYGRVIILDHEDGHHSLLAGLEKIATVIGQNVTVGEPLGTMPHDPHTLYYELRYQGKPIDPTTALQK